MGNPKVGIVGCGTIGSEVAKACQGRLKGRLDLIAICDIDEGKAVSLKKILKKNVKVLKIDELVKNVDLVVEAASAKVSAEVLEKAVRNKKDVLIMSVGGLLGRDGLLESAKASGIRVYVPSGAICGMDGLRSASIGRIDSVRITTRKPPKALEGAPYLNENSIDLKNIKEETVLFEGNASDAMKGFPQNANVSATLSLAGIGPERTWVRIVTSPDYTRNIHEVEIAGSCGVIKTRTENVPSGANPKTSELAILSAIAALEGIVSNVRIGS